MALAPAPEPQPERVEPEHEPDSVRVARKAPQVHLGQVVLALLVSVRVHPW